MKTNRITSIPECSRPRWPFQRHSVAWLPTLTLCLLGCLLTARGQDPWLTNIKNPVDTNVSVGATLSFRAYPSTATPSMTLQWQHEGTNLPGATSSILLITNVTVAHAGGYMAWVTNAIGGFTNTRTAMLTMDPTFVKINSSRVVTDVESSICASWFDYDNDGDLDLFVATYRILPCSLYQNNGDGTFTKVTSALTQSYISDAIAAPIADFDNDGLLDVFLVRHDSGVLNLLFRNLGSGSWAKLADSTFDTLCTGSSDAAWVDYDRDGFVDLFNQNGYGSRVNDALYRNLRNGTFHKMPAAEVGLGSDIAAASGCAWSDYDNDGWPDVFLTQTDNGAVDFSGLFRNDGHGAFSRVNGIGIELPSGQTVYSPSWVDYDSDGLPDLFLYTWPNSGGTQLALLYRNLGNGTFTNVSGTGIFPSQDFIGGELSAWGDFDNDGFIDVLTQPFKRSTGPGFLYRNLGNGTFHSVPAGSPFVDGRTIQNATWGDYNNDGFLDLFLSCGSPGTAEQNHLYQNYGPGAGNTNHWLKVKLEGRASNRAAIGAKVRVLATIAGTPRSQLREISGNYGYLSREVPCLIPHFGLGDATNVTTLRIEWPSGIVQELHDVAVNQFLTVVECQGYSPTNTRPVFTGATKDASGSQLTFTEPAAGARYIVEASTDLVNWTKLLARTSIGVTTNYTDTRATNYPSRFYRLQVP